MFWFVVDIVMVIITLITTLISFNRGFISSLVRVVGVFIAIFVCVVVSKIFAEVIFTAMLRESLVKSVASKINLSEGVERAVESLETGFIGLLIGLFSSKEKLILFIENAVIQDEVVIAGRIVDGVIKAPVVALIKVILSIIVFSVTILIVMLIAKSTGLLNRVPVIGGVNKFFGAVIGLLYGIAICFIIACVISFFIILTDTQENNLPLIQQHSYILAWFMRSRYLVIF